MPLPNQDTRMMDTLGQPKLVDTGLQSPLQEILDLERQHVIELHARFIEHTHTDKTTDEGIAFKETLGVLLVKGE